MAKKLTAPAGPAPIGFGRRPMPEEAGDTPLSRKPSPEDDVPAQEPEFSDPNFDALMAEIGNRFEPADSLEQAGLQLTTKDVFDRLYSFYPSPTYSVAMVYNALAELGFKYDDPYRNMSYVWLFK